MSSRPWNPAPTLGTVMRAQLRMVALLQRRDFLVLGGIMAGLVALAVYGQVNVEFGPQSQNDAIIPVFPIAAIPLLPIGLLWPLTVWRLDDPSRRGYFWSMPVAQGPHTLLRVAAGWVTLMCVCMVVVLAAIAMMTPSMVRFEEMEFTFANSWVPFLAPTLPYLLMSVLVVAFEHPFRLVAWFWAAVLGALAIDAISHSQLVYLWVGRTMSSLGLAIFYPVIEPLDGFRTEGRWWVHYLGWFAAGAALLVLAAFRRRDTA